MVNCEGMNLKDNSENIILKLFPLSYIKIKYAFKEEIYLGEIATTIINYSK